MPKFHGSTIASFLIDHFPPTVVQVLFVAFSPLINIYMVMRLLICTLQLFGMKNSAQRAYRTATFRYRAPYRDFMVNAPGPQSIVELSICFIIIMLYHHNFTFVPNEIRGYWRVLLAFGFIGFSSVFVKWAPGLALIFIGFGYYIAFLAPPGVFSWFIGYTLIYLASSAICFPILSCIPPTVLYLGISGYGQFRTMKRLNHGICPIVMSLINQNSSSVNQHYREHYRGLGANPASPRLDSLRTRNHLWERTVVELSDDVPIIVIDLRERSPIVLRELMMIMTEARLSKTLFVIDNRAQRDLIAEVILDPAILTEIDKKTCTEDEIIEKIISTTQSASSLATWRQTLPLHLDLERAQPMIGLILTERKEGFESLIADIAKGSGPNAELEAEIAEFAEFAGMELPSEQNAGFTGSLDAAIALIKRSFENSSITLRIHTDNLGQAELGVRNPQGIFRVFKSADSLDPTRATLQAFVMAVFGQSI